MKPLDTLIRRAPMLAALGALATACSGAYSAAPAEAQTSTGAQTSVDAGDEFRWRGRLAAGQHIEIKGVNGRVTAVPASGDYVDVRASKSADAGDRREVKIEVAEHADGVTICAIYPTRSGARPNRCEPGSGGRNDTQDNKVRVDFTVEVPAEVGFVGRTVNGAVDVGKLASDVDAHTVNGSIRIDRARRARARTVNGSIDALLTAGDWADPLEFRTVNGSIRVMLPTDTDADVHLRTVSGRIESDFPLTVRGTIGPQRIDGTIGQGGAELNAETVNGSVTLRRQG